jgi:1-acyl-sn-glycerol-3-phosphate acyltransferase
LIGDDLLTIYDPRDRKRYIFHRTLFRKILVSILRVLLRAIMVIDTKGLEQIPSNGAVILASNHLTNFDVFPLQMVIMRPLFFMAKSDLHKNLLADAFLRNLGAFPVHRGQRDKWAIQHAEKVLDHGQILAIFPEGTRSKGRGLRAGKTGTARIAIKMGCPVVPVAVDGTQNLFKSFPKRTSIRIVIGKPIYPKPDESTLGLTDRIMFSIAKILPAALKGVYAQKPIGFDAE